MPKVAKLPRARRYDSSEIYDAASFACMKILPRSQQSAYVQDIRVDYSAEEIVYIFQALSYGLTTIFTGLLTNYLYDKMTFRSRARRDAALFKAIREQLKELKRLDSRSRHSTLEREAYLLLRND